MDETWKYLSVIVFTLKLHRGPRVQGSSSASFILMSELSAGHTVGLIHMGLEEDLKSGFKTWPPAKRRASGILGSSRLQGQLR